MKKGFTLIELLAVIVTLAIIALIATPIVLNIISDSKEESNKISIEMYAKAVENAVAKYQLDGKKLDVNKLETTDGRNFSNIDDFKVDYEGNVVCETIVLFKDGNIYLDKCKVNGEDVEYIYGKNNVPEPVSFSNDSWETISKNVQIGNLSKYKVGDTKEIKLESFTNQEPGSNGLYTVRIANISSDDPVCQNDNYSKTACGFVVEFVDIITTHNMNSTSTNVGGYPASEMYTYIQNYIYGSLSKSLKEIIKDTKVVSSHGWTVGEKNFISKDKLYLLSTKEVWGQKGTSTLVYYDSAEEETRQLDYYKDVVKVTTEKNDGAEKKYNGSGIFWWLRSASYSTINHFWNVIKNGDAASFFANDVGGVAPAFRIG